MTRLQRVKMLVTAPAQYPIICSETTGNLEENHFNV